MHYIDRDSKFTLFAEGDYVRRASYSGISAVHGGDALFGLPASDKQVSIRSFDIYRREGDLLAENWCLMDMADLFNQLGIDVLRRVGANRFYQRT
jgi:predicted ester cyclase